MLEAIGSGTLGCVFVLAGVSKMLRLRSVRRTVEAYQLLPTWSAGAFATLLGPAETATGVLLLLSPVLAFGQEIRAIGGLELLAFTGAIGSALARGIRIPCGCGPLVGDHAISTLALVRNGALLALVLATLTAAQHGT